MRERIWGVLAGGALGDALGMPTECWSQEKIRQQFPNGVTTLIASNEADVFGRKLAAGSITDDTINVLMILSMIKKIRDESKYQTTWQNYESGMKIHLYQLLFQDRRP
ncbi:ADP-ribosylglycohydrolase family protein [Enterococcus crotali]|uniref:ADP-ribosylglycohydrolase family protein n=1 Tax=Enterococcus crotali TaxID=1453587 RepID=UPI000AA26C41|nr:ADP-ribosylglycohydrolase family protein [Enterococcus crotali]